MNSPIAVELLEGERAAAALRDASFVSRWRDLAAACPWATAFQQPEFAQAWYAVYKRSAPILIVGKSAGGELEGLFALAGEPDGSIVAAGGRQAEYQVWVTSERAASEFPRLAMEALRPRLRTRRACFQFIPPGTPLGWMKEAAEWTDLEPVRRPLTAIDGAALEESWKKKSNKSRFNRLARHGALSFERLTEPSQLRAVLDEVAVLYDIRQASISGTAPFSDDREKALFHLALMETPGLLHVTVLKAGEALVSAHIGVASSAMAHIGILAHAPSFARHSPGKLHVMYLARTLAAEGVPLLDLTPGDDPWKERTATTYDEVGRFHLFAAPADRQQAARRQGLRTRFKGLVRSIGVSPQDVAQLARSIRSKGPGQAAKAVLRRAGRLLPHTVELRGYSMIPGPATDSPIARRDHLEDLLLFREAPGTQSRADFYRTALSRLEEGHHCYTVVLDGRLAHWGWVTEQQTQGFMEEVHQYFTYPERSVALYDFFTDPAFRGRGLYGRTIKQMLADVRARDPETRVFIFVEADNGASRHVIEKSGFEYAMSFFERVTLRGNRQWRSDGPIEQPPQRPQEPAGPEAQG